jgi:hypothetical protein
MKEAKKTLKATRHTARLALPVDKAEKESNRLFNL